MSMIHKEFRGQQRRRKDAPNDEASQPLFLKKTYNMISNCPSDIAGWSEDGTSIVVRDANRLAAEIIPTVYKHNKFSSFVRQLNFYGFRKLRFESRANYWEFKHPLFRRGDMASISQIKKSAHFQEENVTTTAVKEVKEEVGDVKNQLSDLNKRMTDLDNMIVSLSKILIQSSNLSTQSSSSLLALTNTHNGNNNNIINQNSSFSTNQNIPQQYQSVIIKEEYSNNGPSESKKRKTKSSSQKQSPVKTNSDQQYIEQQQQLMTSSSSSSYSSQAHVPMSIVPLSRSLSLQSTQSSSQFLLNRSFSMNGSSVIGEYMEVGGGANGSGNNSDDDFNFEYLFALEEKELLLKNQNEINENNTNNKSSNNNMIVNTQNVYDINNTATANNSIPFTSASVSSSSKTMNTGRIYTTAVTDAEVSLPVTTVVNENAVDHQVGTTKNNTAITGSTTAQQAVKQEQESNNNNNMSKLANVIDKVDVTDISAIIAVLPRHLQDRFIDQLAASMQLKVHENNYPTTTSSAAISVGNQQQKVSSSSMSINSTDTAAYSANAKQNHQQSNRNSNGNGGHTTSFQVIPHHDHNDLTFTYHCPVVNSSSTADSITSAVKTNNNTSINSAVSVTGDEVKVADEEVNMVEIHSKLTSQLTVAAVSVAAACSPDTNTGATILSMVDKKTVASFAGMIMKYVYSQDIDSKYKTLQQQQEQQQQKVGYVH